MCLDSVLWSSQLYKNKQVFPFHETRRAWGHLSICLEHGSWSVSEHCLQWNSGWHWWLMKFAKAVGLDICRCAGHSTLLAADLLHFGIPGSNMFVFCSCSKCEVQKCLKIFQSILGILHHMVTIFMVSLLLLLLFWGLFGVFCCCCHFFSNCSKTSLVAGRNILS